jgi:5-methylcytosine-specific restriction endonuclease McrA
MSLAAKKRFADNNNNPNYKGGVEKLGIPLFDTFASKLDYVEDVKLVIKNGFRRLGVKCTYCGEWFTPTLLAVRNRLAALKQDPKGRTYGECRLYCSENCKLACPTYGRKVYPRGFKHTSSREVNPYLRKMVLERDNWTCQICGKTSKEAQLHVHHMDPVAQNPMFQNDMDSCVTLCKTCHKMVHSRIGCRYIDLRCKEKVSDQFTVKGYGVS